MKRVNNKDLKKTFKKNFITLIVSLVFLFIAISCLLTKYYLIKKEKDNSIYLNDVILDMSNKPNVKSYLDVYAIEILVAKSNVNKDLSIYIVSDDSYYYLVALDSKTHTKIKNSDLDKKPYRIYGTTVTTDNQIKQIIINAYNDNVSDEKDKLDEESFKGVYGGVYLDVTKTNETSDILLIITYIFGLLSGILIIAFIINILSTNKVLKHLSDDDLAKLEKEIEDEKALKYPKYNIMLTDNYIINTYGKLRIIKITDLIWIYEYKLKQRGIITNKSLAAMTTKGKTIYLVQLSGSKKMDSILAEIIAKITSINKNILVGYTPENSTKAKQIVKELKTKLKENNK